MGGSVAGACWSHFARQQWHVVAAYGGTQTRNGR